MGKRLQRILAESGLMSRRNAETAILNGRVMKNGRIAVLGDTADAGDVILLDGKPIPDAEPKQYYMLNKPRGYLCTLHDEKGRKTVRELLPSSAGRVYPVGRLDCMSEGLLLLTNDGEFAYRVTHPSAELLKIYRVSVYGDRIEGKIQRMREPFILDGYTVQARNVSILRQTRSSAVFEMTICEGRTREIRRMCEDANLIIKRLIRIQEGEISIGELSTGMYRQLTDAEVLSVLGERD